MADKTQALKVQKLICVRPGTNNNKYWCAYVMPNGELLVEYGRVGNTPRTHVYACGSSNAANNKLATLVWEKTTQKGYTFATVDTDTNPQLDWSQFPVDAVNQLQQKLSQIQAIGDKISRDTLIKFDCVHGLFITDLGAINQSTINRATLALNAVERSYNQDNSSFNDAVGDYLRCIPLPVGRKLDARAILGTRQLITQQRQILSLLQNGLEAIESLRLEMLSIQTQSSSDLLNDRSWWVRWGIDSVSPSLSTENLDNRSYYVQFH
ncbi:MAG: WGR domain-containing protein [Trichormus sp. ATA11-4-KO1]|jgi:predicted DNA-binding WGR domain protein|nr:WGR domain-containing protein [Trichormus sp. ATA11-4-KO1]